MVICEEAEHCPARNLPKECPHKEPHDREDTCIEGHCHYLHALSKCIDYRERTRTRVWSSFKYGPLCGITKTPRKNAQAVTIENGPTFYFSYRTIIAVEAPEIELTAIKNYWQHTTGRQLNALEPDHTARLDRDSFTALIETIFNQYDIKGVGMAWEDLRPLVYFK